MILMKSSFFNFFLSFLSIYELFIWIKQSEWVRNGQKQQFLPPETLKSANNDVTSLIFFMFLMKSNVCHFFLESKNISELFNGIKWSKQVKNGQKWQFLPPETLKNANDDVTNINFFMILINCNVSYDSIEFQNILKFSNSFKGSKKAENRLKWLFFAHFSSGKPPEIFFRKNFFFKQLYYLL